MRDLRAYLCLSLLTLFVVTRAMAATDNEPDGVFEFDDFPLDELVQHPPWFKQSFMDLGDDLVEAVENGKQGIIVYFGQRRCAYCKMLMEVNFQLADIVNYTRKHFDVVSVDIWSPEELTDPSGEVTTQREFSIRLGTNFTPSLVFFDKRGQIVLRLRGYYPPYQFMAALEYVAGEHYKREAFPVYMARGDATQRFEKTDLNEQEFFSPEPHNLDRSRIKSDRPLVVFFEQGDCHACDVLHTQPLTQESIRKLFQGFDNVQINMHADTPLVTPDGRASTARKWAQELGIFYAPSIVFFDEGGKEIIRVDSVVRFFRLRNVLNYIISKGYRSYPDFQRWRAGNAL